MKSSSYVVEMREKELVIIIEQERLKPIETRVFIGKFIVMARFRTLLRCRRAIHVTQ